MYFNSKYISSEFALTHLIKLNVVNATEHLPRT